MRPALTFLFVLLTGGAGLAVDFSVADFGAKGDGVHMANEVGSFYEGPVPQNCIIRSNVFRNIQRVPIVVGSKRALHPAAYASNIRIIGNRIEGRAAPLIQAFSVSGLNISSNKFSVSYSAAGGGGVLSLTHTLNETVSDNEMP